MKKIIVLVIIGFHSPIFGQVEKDSVVLVNPMSNPVYLGGHSLLMKFIKENLKYPNGDSSLQGKVFVEFKISKEGTISDYQVIRGVSKILDEEALRVVKLIPDYNWTPARLNGRNIDCIFTVPVFFKL